MPNKQSKVIAGKLGKKQIANHCMPVDAPYYQSPPFYYRDARAVTVIYETDAAAVVAILPKALDLPLPATMNLQVIHYPFSTFGEYREAILSVNCIYNGTVQAYVAHIVVDSVPPLVAGREIWGYPKKMAEVTLEPLENLYVGTVLQPSGVPLVDVSMRPERAVKVDDNNLPGGLSLRVIPDPRDSKRPSSCELIGVSSAGRVTHEAWSGPASINFGGLNQFLPWAEFPVKSIVGALYTRADFIMPHGKVLETF